MGGAASEGIFDVSGRVIWKKPRNSVLVGMLAWAAATGTACADIVTYSIPNASFESPQTNYASIYMDSWQKAPPPAGYTSDAWNLLAGEFLNPPTTEFDYITNMDGSQAAFLFEDPQVEIFQDLGAVYQVGQSYQLTVGVIMGKGMLLGVPLQLRLYYRDPNITSGDNRVTIASTTILNTNGTNASGTYFYDYDVITPTVESGDAWAGMDVGVQIISMANSSNEGGYWDLDNVRLTSVPGGDANRDGQITLADYLLTDAGYLTGGSTWAQGDFNGDGVVNGEDYTILDAAYAAEIGATTSSAGLPGATVPEPGALALLAAGTGGTFLFGRRHRREAKASARVGLG